MWIAWTAVGIVSAAIVVALVLATRRPSTTSKRLQQPDVESAAHGRLPEPGSGEVPRRRDGRLMPGSQDYRNNQGRP